MTTVDENSVVALIGSGSSDSDGSINSYLWEQTDTGPAIAFADVAAADTTITVPLVDSDTTFALKLTVTDDDGDTSSENVTLTANNVVTEVWYVTEGFGARYSDGDALPVADPDRAFPIGCSNADVKLSSINSPFDSRDGQMLPFDVSADNSKLAFVADCDTAGEFSLYAMNTDGTGHYRVVNATSILRIAMSPDGKWLAYLINNGGQVNLFVAQNNGVADQTPITVMPTRATSTTLDVARAVWTPDSRRLIFVGEFHTNAHFEVWSADFIASPANPPTMRAILDHTAFTHTGTVAVGPWTPRWMAISSNEVWFASNHTDGLNRLYSSPLDASAPTEMANAKAIRDSAGNETSVQDIALSNDASRLAVIKAGPDDEISLFAVDADGSGSAMRLTAPGSGVAEGYAVSWSPDDSLLAHASDRDTSGKIEPWVVRTNGSHDHWKVATVSPAGDATYDLNEITPLVWNREGSSLFYMARGSASYGDLFHADARVENGAANQLGASTFHRALARKR